MAVVTPEPRSHFPRSYSSSEILVRLRRPYSSYSSANELSKRHATTQSKRSNSERPATKLPGCSPNPSENLSLQLCTAKAHIIRLRLDRNHWRARAVDQKNEIRALNRQIRLGKNTISKQTSTNEDIETRLADAVTTSKNLQAEFQKLTGEHQKQAEELKEKDRMIGCLKKSDRGKGKAHQRNLQLKSLLGSFHSRTSSSFTSAGNDTNDAALEALASATDRIGKLENAGKKLLDALERRIDSSDDESEEKLADGEEEEGELGVLEAEIQFRGVLEDEEFREERERWSHLLED